MPLTDSQVTTLLDRYTIRDTYAVWTSSSRREYASAGGMRQAYARHLAKEVNADTPTITGLGWCARCAYPELKATMSPYHAGGLVCSTCVRSCDVCECCNKYSRRTNMYNILGDTMACNRCITTRYNFCAPCDGYYRKRDRAAHRHDTVASCCSSPQLKFTIPNNGADPLKNDTYTTVSLPAGEISEVGLDLIRTHLMNESYYCEVYDHRTLWYQLATRLRELGAKWQTKEGNYAKRLSRFAYKEFGLKVPPNIMTLVGNAARDHSTGVDFKIEVTRQLNQRPSRFVHAGSCWWQSYSRSRCVLKTNGGFALRSFGAGSSVTGRVWVLPLKKTKYGSFTPTFDTMNAEAYALFNGYGELTGYKPARILSQMMGTTYRKVAVDAHPMYINGDSGYLVGPEEVVSKFTDGRVSLEVTQHSNLFNIESRELVNA